MSNPPLKRSWYGTGNHSSGGSKRLLVIHTMEGFTGPEGAKDCAIYFQSDCGASSQVCIDNNRGRICEGVSRNNSAWTQCNYNSVSISCEQSGYASWSRDYWLSNRENQLRNIADWLAEESRATGIPLVDLSGSSAQGSGRGVCYHSELGSSGCGHSDPGSGFPLDKVLEWAKGGGDTSQPAPEEQLEDYMIAIPPADSAAETPSDIGFSFPKHYTQMGLMADVGRLGSGTVKVRFAFRRTTGSYKVVEVTLTAQNSKAVINFGEKDYKFDGVGIWRSDTVPITLYPNFA
jgi:N-acetylmuramoyl-L-alanine amidase-like protein